MIDIGGKVGWDTTSNKRSNENELSRAEKKEVILGDFKRILKGPEFLKPDFFTENAPLYNDNYKTTTHGPHVKPYDELDPYRTSTKRPINNRYITTRPLMDSYPITSTTTSNEWIDDDIKDLGQTMRSLERPRRSYHRDRHYYHEHHHHYNENRHRMYETFNSAPIDKKIIIIAGIVAVAVLVIIIFLCKRLCRNKRRDSVEYSEEDVDDPEASQQHIETDMTPPGQAGSEQYPGVPTYPVVSPGVAQQHLETNILPPGQGVSFQYPGVDLGAGAGQQHQQTAWMPPGQQGSAQYPGVPTYPVVIPGAVQQHLETNMAPPGQGVSFQYPGVDLGAGAVQQHQQTAWMPPGSVQYPGGPTYPVVSPGAVQQHLETNILPPGQGEADYNNMNVREPPRGGDPTHNNGLVEIGFRNECVAMTTTANASGDVNKKL